MTASEDAKAIASVLLNTLAVPAAIIATVLMVQYLANPVTSEVVYQSLIAFGVCAGITALSLIIMIIGEAVDAGFSQ